MKKTIQPILERTFSDVLYGVTSGPYFPTQYLWKKTNLTYNVDLCMQMCDMQQFPTLDWSSTSVPPSIQLSCLHAYIPKELKYNLQIYLKLDSTRRNTTIFFQFVRHVPVRSSNHHQLNRSRFTVRTYNNTTLSIEYINGKEKRK